MNTDREILQHCLNVISRLAPQSIESHLLTLLKMLPFVVQSKLSSIGADATAAVATTTPSANNAIVLDLSQELLNLVDTPLKVLIDEESSQKEEFLISEFNRDGDAYRSPFSDCYILPGTSTMPATAASDSDDAFHPVGILRTLEISLNEAISIYREMYASCHASKTGVIYNL
jgi:F-actin capping protein, beta subunit